MLGVGARIVAALDDGRKNHDTVFEAHDLGAAGAEKIVPADRLDRIGVLLQRHLAKRDPVARRPVLIG